MQYPIINQTGLVFVLVAHIVILVTNKYYFGSVQEFEINQIKKILVHTVVRKNAQIIMPPSKIVNKSYA